MKQPLFSTSYAPRDGESTLDEIELTVIGNALQLQKKHPPGRGQALVDLMRGKATASLNTDEIMQLTRHTDD